MPKIHQKKTKNIFEQAGRKLSERVTKFLLFSLKDFDTTQGQSLERWEREGLLSRSLESIKAHSDKTIPEAEKNMLKVYNELNGKMPSKSEFKYPNTVKTELPVWASLRFGGKERIIGHIVDNVFYIVFLDKEHQFWPTEKRHT
jgi:hypothetical protein